MSTAPIDRAHVIRSDGRFAAYESGYIHMRPLALASTWDRYGAHRIADELTAFNKVVFAAIPDPRTPRVVRGKGQRRNRRRPS
jgi:hypothetical protein